jgi:hypothetical protein
MRETLRLLVPTKGPPSSNCIILAGVPWHVESGKQWLESERGYICVSYAWGNDTMPNDMYGGGNLMSSRTKSVLQTAIETLAADETTAVWIDAYCLPPRGDPSRTLCIDRMGDIYASASKVVVVLSGESKSFLEMAKAGIKGQATMDHVPPLELLEKDPWVTRAWTYQEITNSNGSLFVTEGFAEQTAVDGMDLFNAVGNVRLAYRRPYVGKDGRVRAPDSETVVRLRLPNVDLLEDVLVDCVMNPYLERSALATMANVDRRVRERGEDYFNAMIGTISSSTESNSIRANWKNITESPDVTQLANELKFTKAETSGEREVIKTIIEPIKFAFAADKFMQICESKGDYSFIFTTAKRSNRTGQHWRPVPGSLKPICPWHSWGSRQPGMIEDGHLCLQEMLPMSAGALNADAIQFVTSWVRLWHPNSPETIPELSIENVLRCLAEVGSVSDCNKPFGLEMEHGYFFPQTELEGDVYPEVFVSSAINWVFGAPGVLVSKFEKEPNTYTFHSVGVFVGDVRNMQMSKTSLILSS